MPGILPMKVIKVGNNAQSRIAQACDRCRSKKIRCDGIRPTCSQCANVGFECKTSDKLSRRAFPRGYTESLEERVRGLEQEVRELKELLDEKDEKIDMLTRIHSQSPHVLDLSSTRRRSSTPNAAREDVVGSKDDTFNVQQSPHLEGEGASSYFAGSSSTRIFLEAFKRRVQETGRSTADIDTDRLLDHNPGQLNSPSNKEPRVVVWKAPPRLLSDQLINIFFQEWAPLFPILHRPTFLGLYEKYVADSDAVTDRAELAQLNLVFGIAALSNNNMRTIDDLVSFEEQWKAAIDAVLKDNTIATLQALILAQIYCILKDDLQSLLTYKGLSMTLSARLGLHQSQKRFALGTLTCETRKKVFWTLYAVDCFTAVVLGMPKQLKDEDIQCEYPVDADDEYVTERGFTPTLPGETTKLSSALALFRATRILSKILEEVFPAKACYDLSLKKLSELSDELESWSASLPPHLRLQFVQDKPSTGTINSRSPILSLMYHYTRALLQRPVVCASLGSRSSSAMLSMASSCKHMVQIIQLLNERGMSFSFCLNRDEVLVLSGFGLLFQGINLDPNSKILKDNSKMINAVIGILDKADAPCASEFKRVARSFIPELAELPRKETVSKAKVAALSRHNSDGTAQPVITSSSSSPTFSTRKNLKAIASRFTSSGSPKKGSLDATDHRRASTANISLHPQGLASQSVPSLQQPSNQNYKITNISRSEPARSPVNLFASRPSSTTERPTGTTSQQQQQSNSASRHRPNTSTLTNLDYLSFGNEPSPQPQPTNHTLSKPIKTEPSPTDWERLVGNLSTDGTSLYDIYNTHSSFLDIPGLHHSNHSAQTLDHISFNADLWALAATDSNSVDSLLTTSTGPPGSVLSLSTDERDVNSSTEDFSTADWVSPPTADSYRGICMPEWADDLAYGNSWETPLNL